MKMQTADSKNEEILVALFYKNKMLLVSKDNYYQGVDSNVWSLISERKIKKMQLQDVEFVKSSTGLYYIQLCDKHVNRLIREDGMRLEFYRFDELWKLILTDQTRFILSYYHQELTALLK